MMKMTEEQIEDAGLNNKEIARKHHGWFDTDRV